MGKATEEVLAAMRDNKIYLVFNKAAFSALPEAIKAKIDYDKSLGAYDRWLRDELRVVPDDIRQPFATQTAAKMANNAAFRKHCRAASIADGSLAEYEIPADYGGDAKLGVWIALVEMHISYPPPDVPDRVFAAYKEWLELQLKKTILAIAGEAPVERLLGTKDQEALILASEEASETIRDGQKATTTFLDARRKGHEVKQRALDLLHKHNRHLLRRTLVGYGTEDARKQLFELMKELYGKDPRHADLKDARAIYRELGDTKEQKDGARKVAKEAVDANQELADKIRHQNERFIESMDELYRVWKVLERDGKLQKGSEEYDSLVATIGAAVSRQSSLLRRRELRALQAAQLEKIDKVKRGLRVYCGFTGFAYPLLSGIGSLIAGDGDKLAAIQGIGTIIQGVKGIVSLADKGSATDVFGGLGIDLAQAAKLAKSKAFDTGSLTVTLTLGLSYGQEGIFDAGVALVYTGTIQVGDNRKFKSAASLSIEGEISAGHKKVLEAGLKAELVADVTEFSFNDVHHWAAWLAQKWANTCAWAFALGANVYSTSKTDAPTTEELEFMKMVAEVYQATDPEMMDVLSMIQPFLDEPVTRGDAFELLPSISGSIGIAECFGVGYTLPRTASEMHYYKRSTHEGELVEKTKTAESTGISFPITFPLGKITIASTEVKEHPNPDNDGEYWSFKFELGSGKSTLVKHETPDEVPEAWKELDDKLEALKHAPKIAIGDFWEKSEVMGLTSKFNLAACEIVCIKKHLVKTREHKLCMQFMRGYATVGVSADASIPTPVIGMKVNLGAEVKVTRTFWERLGASTMTYVHKVFHGFRGIKPVKATVRGKEIVLRERSFDELWTAFKEGHQSDFNRIFKTLSNEKSFLYREIMDDAAVENEARALARACEGYDPSKWVEEWDPVTMEMKSSPNWKHDAQFSRAMERLEAYLDAFAEKVYDEEKKEGWADANREFHFALNPLQLARNIRASRTQIAKLQASEGVKRFAKHAD